MKLGKIAQPVRVALTGGTISPGLFEIIDVLGKKPYSSVFERVWSISRDSLRFGRFEAYRLGPEL